MSIRQVISKSLRFEAQAKALENWIERDLYVRRGWLNASTPTTIEEVSEAIDKFKALRHHEVRVRREDDVYYVELYTEDLGGGLLKKTVLEPLEKYGDLAVESGIVSKAQLAWMKAMVERTPYKGWEYGLNVEVDESGRLKIYAYNENARILAERLESFGLREGGTTLFMR